MICAICNPIAGNGRGKKTGERIGALLSERGEEYRLLWTEGPGHASALAREASAAGAKTVLSIGGFASRNGTWARSVKESAPFFDAVKRIAPTLSG